MRKRIIILSFVMILTMLTGCENHAKLEYEPIDKVQKEIRKALNNEYENINIAKNISVEIPNNLYTYDKKITNFTFNKEDSRIKETIKLLYNPDDFNKDKNPNDIISTVNRAEGSGCQCYQFFNETKDEHVAIEQNGYIHLGPTELLNYDVIECEYVKNVQDDQVYQKVLKATNAKMKELSSILNDLQVEPYLFYKVKSECGNTFYMIYYCKTIDGVYSMPFGTDNITNVDITKQDSDFKQRWFKEELSIWVGENMTVRALHNEQNWSAKPNDTVTKIPTLDSVLNYISKEIAPNYKVEITNIQLMYGMDNVETKIYPIWYIEFKNNSSDIGEYNRIIVNTTTGIVSSYIEGCYNEYQG